MQLDCDLAQSRAGRRTSGLKELCRQLNHASKLRWLSFSGCALGPEALETLRLGLAWPVSAP